MKGDIHEHARQLMAAGSTEISDSRWLESHVRECAECARYREQIESIVRALRSVSVMPSPGLVSVTQINVRLRARELRERQARLRPLWIACTVAILLSLVTTPYLWMGFSWAAHSLGLPDLLWQTGFVMVWMLPAILVASLVIAWRRHVDQPDQVDVRSRG